MVHWSSLCYKDLTLRHIVVINYCQARTSDKLEKCVHGVVLCCVQYAEIYTEQRAFANDNNFSFLFEENCC